MDDAIESFQNTINELKKEAPSSENELIQHLVELGYLNVSDVENSKLLVLQKKALKNFWDELIASELFPKEEIDTSKICNENELELSFLRKIKDLDEGVILTQIPELGVCNLQSRIIHYRLDILGLLSGTVNKVFDNSSLADVQELSNQLKEFDSLVAINAVANMETLTSRFIECIGKENCLLIFRVPLGTEKLNKFENKSVFKKTLKEEFEKKSEFFRKIRKSVIKNNNEEVDYGFLEDRIKSSSNTFLLRLIQVHQWMDGFYTGLLDSDLGEVSFDSITKSIQLFNEDDNEDDVKSKEVLFHSGKGYFVFNALFFLEKYKLEEQKVDYQNEVVNILNQNMAKATSEDQKTINVNSDKIMKAALSQNDERVSGKNGLLKRLYYGLKSFFRNIFKLGEKIFKWIKDKLDKMFAFLREFFRKMFVHLRKALYYFAEGVKYIIGKNPLVKVTSDNKLIYSKILLDGDTNCIVSKNCSVSDHQQYRKETRIKIQSMVFSVSVITTVIKAIQQMLTILTWPLLLLNIIRSFKEIIADYKLIGT